MPRQESQQRTVGFRSRWSTHLSILGTVISLLVGLGLASASLALYFRGKPLPYNLPQDWGRVRFLIPPGVQRCTSTLVVQYQDGKPELLLGIGMNEVTRSAVMPMIGIAFDGGARPVGNPFPYGEELTYSGSPPDSAPAGIVEPFGTYLGQVWWFRLPARGQEYRFRAPYPADSVADNQPLDISGHLQNVSGADTLTVSLRPSAAFRTSQRGRLSYRTPELVAPVTVRELAAPATARDIPNGEPAEQGSCPAGSQRQVIVSDEQNIDAEGRLGPLYRLDTVVPKPAVEGALKWTTESDVEQLQPVASVLDREVEQDQQDSNILASVGAGAALPVLGYGFSRLWRSVSSRSKKRSAKRRPRVNRQRLRNQQPSTSRQASGRQQAPASQQAQPRQRPAPKQNPQRRKPNNRRRSR